MNQTYSIRNRNEQQFGFLHRYLTIMYVLKNNFSFGKTESSIFQFLNIIHPLFLTLQSQKFITYKQNWIYKLFQLLLRPDQIYEQYLQYGQYMFFVSLFMILIGKFFIFYFQIQYYSAKNPELFLKGVKGFFLTQIAYFLLCSYQLLLTSYFFNVMLLFCITSLKTQLLLAQQGSINYNILVLFNIVTVLLLCIELIISTILLETPITHQINGLDRTKVTFNRIIYQILNIISTIMVIYIDQMYVEFILSALVIIQQLILLQDQFMNRIFLLSYQQYPLLLAATINLTFHSLVLIFPLKIEQSLAKLPLFIYFILLMQIISNTHAKFENQSWVQLSVNNPKKFLQIKYSLLKILNNDLPSQTIECFVRALIASQHSSLCIEPNCIFCQHQKIMFTDETCAITSVIYKKFLFMKIQNIINLEQLNIRNKSKLDIKVFLNYGFLYYDFGWIIKSIQILCQLKYLTEKNQDRNHEFLQKQNLSAEERENQQKQKQWLHFEGLTSLGSDFNLASFGRIDLISSVKLEYMLNVGKGKMKSILGTSSQANQQQIINNFIDEHVSQEVLLIDLEDEIISVINDKIEFYKILVTAILVDKQIDINFLIYQLCGKFYSMDKKLRKIYNIKPGFKLHKIISFFLAEVLCDYKKAIKFFSTSDFLEFQQLQFQLIKNFNINSENFDFIILETKDDLQHLSIRQFSNKFFNHFGELKSNQLEMDFDQLLPKFLIPYHPYFVKQFLETGLSRFYQMFDITYIRNHNSLLSSTNMCFSMTNLFSSNNITFAVFLQRASEDQVYILVDGETLNCTFTQNLLTLTGWSENEINSFGQQKKFELLPITKFIPNFVRIVKGIKQQSLKVDGIQVYFPNSSDSSNDSIHRSKAQSNQLKYVTSECDLIIVKNAIHNYSYYVINILKITEQQLFVQSQIKSVSQLRIRYDSYCSPSPNFEKFDHSGIGQVNAISFTNQNLPQSIVTSLQNRLSQRTSCEIKDSFSIISKERKNNESYIKLISSPHQQSLSQQQQFFFSLSQFEDDIGMAESNQIDEDAIPKNKKQKVKLNSQTQLKVTKFDDKFELIERVLSLKSPKYLDKLLAIIFLWHAIFLLFIILILISLQEDIVLQQQHIQMLQLYAAVIGPHDLFFSVRVTITAYQQMQREGFIPISILPQLTDPYYQYIDLGYTELRNSLYDQLNNQNLQHFLNDVSVTMQYMKENETQIYPVVIQFREALFVILQYQFSQMMTFYYHQSTSGKPFQISLFANYFMLHSQCEQLTSEIMVYTIENLQVVENKWIIIFFLCFLTQILLYSAIQYYQLYYFRQLDTIFSLLITLSVCSIEIEIVSYQNFISKFKKNKKILYQYDPITEYFIHLENIRKPIAQQTVKNQSSSKNTQANLSGKNKVFHYLLLIGLLILILIYLSIIFAVNDHYLLKYPNTVALFSQLQNLKLRAGNLFLYREIFFRWQNFTFLTNENKLQLYGLINKALNAIDDYEEFSQSVEFSQYLIDESFVDIFQKVNSEDLCQFIDEKFRNLTDKYCNLAFEKSMLNGMISTLSYISDSIQTQQAINNFTKRAEAPYYEQEGSQIITRVFFVLSTQLSNSINNVTSFCLAIIQGLSVAYILHAIISSIILYKYYRPYLSRLFKIFKRTVYIIPFDDLLNNEQLGIKLKELVHRLQLL